MIDDQTIKTIEDELSQVMRKFGIKAIIADVEFDEGHVGLWLPGCKPECQTQDECHAANMLRGSQNLQNYVRAYFEPDDAE